jgi:hypothetical protein
MTYANEEPRHRGQTKTSYSADDPRPLIAEVCTDNPRAGIKELIKLATKAILDCDPQYRETLARHYATNQINYYMNNERDVARTASSYPSGNTKAAREQSAATRQTLVADGIEKAKLLGLLAPNGKPLAKCTFAECKQFGGWYLRLAKGHTDAETVGSCYSEMQLRKLQTWKD